MLSSTRCSTGVPHTASYLVAAQGGNSVDSGPGATPVPHKTGHEELIPDTSFPNLLDLSDSSSWNAHRIGNTWATSLLPVAYDRKILHHHLLISWVVQVYIGHQIKIMPNLEMFADSYPGCSSGTATNFDYVYL